VDQVVVQGEDNLGRYTFARGIMAKTFCKTCGVPLTNAALDLSEDELAALSEGSRKWHARSRDYLPVNLRVLHDFNVRDVKTEKLNGFTHIEPLYVNP
jgi:hypothetical protein